MVNHLIMHHRISAAHSRFDDKVEMLIEHMNGCFVCISGISRSVDMSVDGWFTM